MYIRIQNKRTNTGKIYLENIYIKNTNSIKVYVTWLIK